jgi:hypothetical protein
MRRFLAFMDGLADAAEAEDQRIAPMERSDVIANVVLIAVAALSIACWCMWPGHVLSQ